MHTNPWKQAMIEELICIGIYSEAHDSDPVKALNDIINWNVEVALDPKVSSSARDLVNQGRHQSMKFLLAPNLPINPHD